MSSFVLDSETFNIILLLRVKVTISLMKRIVYDGVHVYDKDICLSQP